MTYKLSLCFVLATAIALTGCDPVGPSADNTDADTSGGGDGGTGQADAATSTDAAPAVANVRVFDNLLDPMVGTKVLFSNPDGTAISVQTTDANGDASEVVPGNAVVTVGVAERRDVESPYDYTLFQIHGVQPGDQIEVGPRRADPDWSSLGTADITFRNDYAGADHYRIGDDCTGDYHQANQAPQQLSVTYWFNNDRCHGTSARRDLLAYAYADSGATTKLAWTTFNDVQIGSTNIVSEPWSTGWTQVQLNANNIPYTGSMELQLRQFKDGIDYSLNINGGDGSVNAGGNLSTSDSMPTGFADAIQVRAQGFGQVGTDSVITLISSNIATTTTNHTVDFAAFSYPSFTATSVDMSTPLAPSIAWTETGTVPTSAEARIFVVGWHDADTNEDHEWKVLAPLSASSPLVSPTLPADFLTRPGTTQNAWPPPVGAVLTTRVAGMVELGDLDGWDEVRQQRGLALFGDSDEFLAPSAPVGTTTMLTAGGLLGFN